MDTSELEEYRTIVRRLQAEAAAEFARATEQPQEQRRACARYFERGRAAGLSVSELIDFLGVSNDCVLDQAGYTDAQLVRVMEALTELVDDPPDPRDA